MAVVWKERLHSCPYCSRASLRESSLIGCVILHSIFTKIMPFVWNNQNKTKNSEKKTFLTDSWFSFGTKKHASVCVKVQEVRNNNFETNSSKRGAWTKQHRIKCWESLKIRRLWYQVLKKVKHRESMKMLQKLRNLS